MAIENVQQLLTEQLGKNAGTEVFTGAVTSKNFYCVYFPVESAVSAITAANVTNAAALITTVPAGTTLFMNVTAMTLTSGIAIGYTE
jgi:hypothetical protein|tara:strand:+ start:1508 stop:1768 length:261 start_codon:yes stop_codon:yes gene_type:complete